MNHRQHKEDRALTSQKNRQTPFWHQRWHACFIHKNVWKRERQRWTDGTKVWETEQETRRWQRESRIGENKCLSFPEHSDWYKKTKKPINSCDIVNPEERASLANSHLRFFNTHTEMCLSHYAVISLLLSAWVCVCVCVCEREKAIQTSPSE